MKYSEFKQDKRSTKTRRLIKLAFLKLVRNKNIDDINVTELTTLAGVNRNSFYTHYATLTNVLDDLNADVVDAVNSIIKTHKYAEFREDPYPLMRDFSNAIAENRYFTEYLLFSRSSGDIIAKLKTKLCSHLHEIYATEHGDDTPYSKYMIAFMVGGVIDIYCEWFSNNKDLPLSDLTKKTADVLKHCMSGMREIKNKDKKKQAK